MQISFLRFGTRGTPKTASLAAYKVIDRDARGEKTVLLILVIVPMALVTSLERGHVTSKNN